MGTTTNKQAAKIAKRAIKQAIQEARATVTGKPELIQRVENASLAGELEGRDAFTNLRRLRGQRLPRGEEVVIARHLYEELPVLKRQLRAKDIPLGVFCSRHGIADASQSSKELHRLTLAPNKSPSEVRLRRTAGKYRSLIEAISKVTNQSVSTLADRVLRHTSLHPTMQMGSLSEAEIVQTTLQRIVDKIDEEFGLHAKFNEIAALKAKHIAESGTEHWPLEEISSTEQWLEILSPVKPDANWLARVERDRTDATVKAFAFWRRDIVSDPADADAILENSEGRCVGGTDPSERELPVSSGVGGLQDSRFFYVPHAPLGVIEFANLPPRHESLTQYEQAVRTSLAHWRSISPETGKSWVAQQYSVSDDWDSEHQCPVGQIDTHRHGGGTEFAWLVIYPTKDGSRLMPMLYIAYEEGGPYLLPLDARILEILRDAIWLNDTEHTTALDRIKDLLGYRDGTVRVIEDGLRRTAPWLDHNPHFKMRRQHENDLQMLEAFSQKLWEGK